VAVTYRSRRDAADAVVESVRGWGVRGAAYQLDVTDPAQAAVLVKGPSRARLLRLVGAPDDAAPDDAAPDDAAPDGIGPDPAPADDPRALDAGADPAEAAADVP
jgi:hypothetical protein